MRCWLFVELKIGSDCEGWSHRARSSFLECSASFSSLSDPDNRDEKSTRRASFPLPQLRKECVQTREAGARSPAAHRGRLPRERTYGV